MDLLQVLVKYIFFSFPTTIRLDLIAPPVQNIYIYIHYMKKLMYLNMNEHIYTFNIKDNIDIRGKIGDFFP